MTTIYLYITGTVQVHSNEIRIIIIIMPKEKVIVALTSYVDSDMRNRLNSLCKDKDISVSKLIKQLLREWMNEQSTSN